MVSNSISPAGENPRDPYMGSPSLVSPRVDPQTEEPATKKQKTPTEVPRPSLKFSRDVIIRITLREGENYQIISPISTDTLEINDKLEVQRTSRKRLE